MQLVVQTKFQIDNDLLQKGARAMKR